MLEYIEKNLNLFSSCFTRRAAFRWFVINITGLMIRSDRLGTTSIIRDLALDSKHYEAMNQFFRASSWTLDSLKRKWFEIIAASPLLYKEQGYTILIGDGVKQAKEGKHMPGVKKLHQDSENSAKPQYFFGHMFGGIGVLAGSLTKWFCIPLRINLQDGMETIRSWDDTLEPIGTHVVQMIESAYEAAECFGNSLLLLDRYFLSVPALEKLKQCHESGSTLMHLVTKAKKSCVAFEAPPEKQAGRGRPRKKGTSVKLMKLFSTRSNQFVEATTTL